VFGKLEVPEFESGSGKSSHHLDAVRYCRGTNSPFFRHQIEVQSHRRVSTSLVADVSIVQAKVPLSPNMHIT
jgi:hypothetical protein